MKANNNSLLLHQYTLITGAREALFAYCRSVDTQDFVRALPAFNGSSMQQLLLHVANTYIHWLSRFALNRDKPYFEANEGAGVDHIYTLFDEVNEEVHIFLDVLGDKPFDLTQGKHRQGRTVKSTPVELFTHVVTHEFHHKGQIMSMSRQLGYVPVDSDVIRF